MEKTKIDRINELGRIAKTRELTEEEKANMLRGTELAIENLKTMKAFYEERI